MNTRSIAPGETATSLLGFKVDLQATPHFSYGHWLASSTSLLPLSPRAGAPELELNNFGPKRPSLDSSHTLSLVRGRGVKGERRFLSHTFL